MATLYTCTAAIGPHAGARLRRHHQYLLDRRATGKRRLRTLLHQQVCADGDDRRHAPGLGATASGYASSNPALRRAQSLKASPIRNIARRFASTSIRRAGHEAGGRRGCHRARRLVAAPCKHFRTAHSPDDRCGADVIGKASRQTLVTSRPANVRRFFFRATPLSARRSGSADSSWPRHGKSWPAQPPIRT